MGEAAQLRFESPGPFEVPHDRLTPVRLTGPGDGSADVVLRDDTVEFLTEGWFEVLMEVHWDAALRDGTRFSHTKIPGQEPLHSEAIDAGVLASLSEGRQLLRGNTIFGREHTSSLALEVWQNSGRAVTVQKAGLIVRALAVPWSPAPG